MTIAFTPSYGSNQVVTLAAGTPQVFRILKADTTLRLRNTGTANGLYFKTYSSNTSGGVPPAPGIAVSTADYGVGPGAGAFVGVSTSHDAIQLFSASGTTVEFMTGIGGL